MVIVRKVPTQVQRTANWLSAELDLADQLAALGFFSSDDDAISTSSSNITPVEIRRPKKRYGGISNRRGVSVQAGLIRDVGRKRVGWRRQRRLDNELTIVHGSADVDIEVDKYLEGSPDIRVELMSAPPSAPLASLFRDSNALKKWQEFAQQDEDEQQRQLESLLESEHKLSGRYMGNEEEMSKPQNFQKALNAAKKQLHHVGKQLCRQLRRLASPQLMASIENELLARMGEAASIEPELPSTSASADGPKSQPGRPVTCHWQTSSIFKAYTEKITLEALCKYYGYRLTWPAPLSSLVETKEEDSDNNMTDVDSQAVDDDVQDIEIFAKNWRWPPVRLANIFFLNQQQQQSVF